MPFPTTFIIDNFNRTENPLSDGGHWSSPLFAGDSAPQANGTQCLQVGANRFSEAYRSDRTYGPDCEVYVTVAALGAGSNPFIQLTARAANEGAGYNGYLMNILTGSDWYISRIDNEVETILGSHITQTVSAGDKFGLYCSGTTLNACYNNGTGWTDLIDRTDVTYQGAGHIGLLFGDNTTWAFDDFGGGTAVLPKMSVNSFPKFFMRQPLTQGRLL